jgi:hypothetical protein
MLQPKTQPAAESHKNRSSHYSAGAADQGRHRPDDRRRRRELSRLGNYKRAANNFGPAGLTRQNAGSSLPHLQFRDAFPVSPYPHLHHAKIDPESIV